MDMVYFGLTIYNCLEILALYVTYASFINKSR